LIPRGSFGIVVPREPPFLIKVPQNIMTKSGAIILNTAHKNQVALLYRGKENDWTFPKGHIEKGEDIKAAVLREVAEETGLSINFIQELPDLVYHNQKDEIVYVKMYLTESNGDSEVRAELNNDSVQWVPYDKVSEKLSYDNLKQYFSSIVPIIKRVVAQSSHAN